MAIGRSTTDAVHLRPLLVRYAQWVTHGPTCSSRRPAARAQAPGALAPPLASAIVNGFDDPRTFFPWFADPVEADRFIDTWASAA
jgi:hypothetical protein